MSGADELRTLKEQVGKLARQVSAVEDVNSIRHLR